ncbi:nucleoside hydrolase [Nocardia niwae]|uniref:nucleoside hydrolase n=1 Tax=Nocardia niwae TaxID=626084 RepID=UPI0033DE38B7
MGDIDDDDCGNPVTWYYHELWRAETYGWDSLAKKLREAGPPPRDLARTPVIFEAPISCDPGYLLALLSAAASKDLALVISSDTDSHALQSARYVLDSVGRDDVPVVAQAQPPQQHHGHDSDGLHAADVEDPSADVLAAVRKVCATTSPAVRWIATGSLTTLAGVLRHDAQLRGLLAVTLSDAEFPHFPADAAMVVEYVEDLVLVRSQTVSAAEITVHDGLLAACGLPADPALGPLLDRWPAHPVCSALPIATTAAGLLMPFEFTQRHVTVSESGQIIVDPASGYRRWVTTEISNVAVWLGKQLAHLPTPRGRQRP